MTKLMRRSPSLLHAQRQPWQGWSSIANAPTRSSRLLHSRQESGEHRPVGINALVAESLNSLITAHVRQSRASTITLEQSLDPAAGKVDVFPQEILTHARSESGRFR
jgi:hypothetical protein